MRNEEERAREVGGPGGIVTWKAHSRETLKIIEDFRQRGEEYQMPPRHPVTWRQKWPREGLVELC